MRNLVYLAVALVAFPGVAEANGKKKPTPASKADIQMVLDALNDLKKTMQDNHTKTQIAFDQLNANLKRVKDDLNAIQANLVRLKIDLAALQTEMTSLKGAVGEIKGELLKMQQTLDAQVGDFQKFVYAKAGVPTISHVPKQGYAPPYHAATPYTSPPSYFFSTSNSCYYCCCCGTWWQYSPSGTAATYWRYVK